MFVVLSRATGAVVANLSSIAEALVADAASHLRVEARGRADILALAAARVDASPDYNSLPDRDENWCRYTSRSGRVMVCEVVRLLGPDSQGFPTLVELINPARPDASFVGQASNVEVIDRGAISDDLWAVLTAGGDEAVVPAEQPRLTKGLRR